MRAIHPPDESKILLQVSGKTNNSFGGSDEAPLIDRQERWLTATKTRRRASGSVERK